MKNKTISNIIKAIFIYPIIVLIAFPIVYLLNDETLKETYKDLIKGFWRK